MLIKQLLFCLIIDNYICIGFGFSHSSCSNSEWVKSACILHVQDVAMEGGVSYFSGGAAGGSGELVDFRIFEVWSSKFGEFENKYPVGK